MPSPEIQTAVTRTLALIRQATRVADRLERTTDDALLALNRWGHQGAPQRPRTH